MPTVYACDGCGAAIPNPEMFGFVKKCGYCEKCSIYLREFYQALDGIHDILAAEWTKQKNVELEKLRDTIPGITLPDNL